MNESSRIVIIGAGPTGLGAAFRLQELGHRAWTLVEADPGPGGLASSVVDDHGFTWDLGGHVLFSHYEYFDRLMDDLLPDAWVEHERESWVWMRERWIPYPLQNNIGRLPPDDLVACLRGLLEVNRLRGTRPPPSDFGQWILDNFGPGLADVFMLPYNRKVWACDPSALDVGWMGERVATVDLGRILENLVRQRDDCGWGPNQRFRFPLRGGTGAIWNALAARLPRDRVHLRRRVVAVDPQARAVVCAGHPPLPYDHLISTMPLDDLLRRLTGRPDLASRAGALVYCSTHVVGVGIEGKPPADLATKNWIYFPEPELPFYRVTVFSNYSPRNVPDPARYWSLMGEVSESPTRPVDAGRIADDVVAGLRRARLLPEDAPVVSLWHRRLEHGYPTPFLGRDAVLAPIEAELRRLGIVSRGRFGSWKYEVSNQDHSLMLGVEAVDHLLFGTEETTFRYPAVVNASRGLGRRPLAAPGTGTGGPGSTAKR
jgi:protoporphyrinogen oxidase